VSGALPLLRLLSLRHFRRHRLRTALALFSVSLGVAAFLGMSALNRGVLDSFARTARLRAGGAELMLRAGRAGIAPAIVDEAAKVAGVRAAVPVVDRVLDVVEPWRGPIRLIGVDPTRLPPDLVPLARDAVAQIASPLALMKGGTPLFFPDHADGTGGIELGLELTVSTPRGLAKARVAGFLRRHGLLESFGEEIAAARLDDALALTSTSKNVDRVQLFLDDDAGADVPRVRAELERVVAGRAAVVDPAELAREYDATMGSFRLALHLLAMLSLLIAAFLVHSTLSMALAERRRELSIARCVGLSAAKLRFLLVAEGGAIGGAGALLGVPLGLLLAHSMGRVFWSTVGATFDRIEATIRAPSAVEIALGVGCGLVAALVAVAPAAFEAARRAPLEGLTAARTEERTARPRPRRLALAGLLVALAVAGYAGDGFGIPHAGYGVAAALAIAIALGAHPLLAFALRGSGPLLLRTLGPAGRLARDHCERAAGPTSLTVVAIALGFGLVFCTDVLVKSYVRMIDRWFVSNVGEDLLVMGGDFLTSGLQGQSFDVALADELRKVPGVLHVHGLRFSRIPYEGERVLLFSLDAGAPRAAGTTLYVEGSEADEPALARGEGVYVSEGFARRFRKFRGSSVTVAAPTGPLELHVLAVVEDYMWPRGTIWIDDDFYRRAFDDHEVQEFGITLDETRPTDEVRRDVEAIVLPRFAAFVVDTPTAEKSVMKIVEQYWTLFFAQEGLAVTVAFLGTLHTLLISALLRRREIALLRSLGAPLRMVGSMLRTEGVLLGLAGGAIGVAFGLATAAVALRMLSLEEQGFAVALHPSAGVALLTVLAAGFTGWLAGVLPGRQAARGAPRAALVDSTA
jgi:putative ABC transport system permease protein